MQYKVLRAGSGDSHPTADSSCECHYEGRTAQSYPNGDTFDSSYARGSPTSFAPNQVIKGCTLRPAAHVSVASAKSRDLTLAVLTCGRDGSNAAHGRRRQVVRNVARPGAAGAPCRCARRTASIAFCNHWPRAGREMYIPSELGYGDRGSPPKIGGGDVLVFTMEILKINGNKVPANKCDVKTLEGCTEKESAYLTAKKARRAPGDSHPYSHSVRGRWPRPRRPPALTATPCACCTGARQGGGRYGGEAARGDAGQGDVG